MKKQWLLYMLMMILLAVWSSCGDWATNVDPLIGEVESESLDNENAIAPLITGVKAQFASTNDYMGVISDLLSDALAYDHRTPGATYSTYFDIDRAIDINLDNYSSDDPYVANGVMRFLADDLVRRVGVIGEFQDADLKNEALLWGNFFGGVARYFYATYSGLNKGEGGGSPIDGGPFIPADQLYTQAAEKFTEALNYADAYMTRVIHSCLARLYLLHDDFTNAKTHALQGLIDGDSPYQSIHHNESSNEYRNNASTNGTTQIHADFRFFDYVTADPAEAARIPLDPLVVNDGLQPDTFYFQGKYTSKDAPINFVSWQENELMLAELEIREGNAAGALTRINAVRASHGLAALATANLDVLIEERDKELFCTGLRLPDQRRFDIWHIAELSWQYFPIPDDERNSNPNIN